MTYIETLFLYNWTIRDRWIDWCRDISRDELIKERVGGHKGFLQTMFHVIDVEQRWLRGLAEDTPINYSYSDYKTLDSIQTFSNQTKQHTLGFVQADIDLNQKVLRGKNSKGEDFAYRYDEVLLHVIAHETHHMGQLSVWARELGKEPVSANLIGLELLK
ncbi:DinB family protein [Aquisalibacillus elongatus]|uniref:Putative damage-inducible protein DinB n=1 Tax=Aquisalibacillus elongatus TaxID=485577 RepID=A0A3N5BLS2_9BACI|nr:DinB family protein [Aquisalibacillus elongatus]RPF50638.1 putative damage-inducible protein DinB [Aquisalibacillus elongatus]